MHPSKNGRPSYPPQVLSTVVVLQVLNGLSDVETVLELCRDLRQVMAATCAPWPPGRRARARQGDVPKPDDVAADFVLVPGLTRSSRPGNTLDHPARPGNQYQLPDGVPKGVEARS
ncbi:transposase [Streptomyces sp. NPDC050516]|uniref:transposase n=1 Tax=Streptomyces sp. NPDC050516 TaxID=3365621 RepID=UPI0037930231